MVSRVIQYAKAESETISLDFDFGSEFAEGELILGKETTAVVWAGTDAAPSAIIDGAATSSGSVVSQLVTAGEEGVQYLLTCAVTTSLGQTLAIRAYLSVLEG